MTTTKVQVPMRIPSLHDEARNVNDVKVKWRKWSEGARRMFNYVYAQGVVNKSIFRDLFDDTPPIREAVEIASWNMAWMAADFHDELNKLNLS